MGKLIIINAIAVLLTSCSAADVAKQEVPLKRPKVVVAVIDTGIDIGLMNKPWICKFGNKDFTGTGLKDNHGHGTHIAGIIEQYAKNTIITTADSYKALDQATADFCVMVIKFYDPKAPDEDNLEQTIAALKWAIDQKVNIINYSAGGTKPSSEEKVQILRALRKGIKIVAAAGNEHSDIDKHKYFPAMYDPQKITIVGNLVSAQSRSIASSSNYGKSVNTWEVGTNVVSRLPGMTFGTMSGTSQATAIKSGKIVRQMLLTK